MSGEANADVVSIGGIPVEAFGEWPGLTTRSAVVTDERRLHIVAHHPEVLVSLHELARTLLDPDEAHRYHELNMLELFRWCGAGHAWTVKVRIASEEGLSNSTLTFYQLRRDRVEKRRRRADSFWTRG